ncbi:MAG: Flagellar M-ring protein [Thermocaproicibacter melissae]|jgi:flagellar M-ring protein FliF
MEKGGPFSPMNEQIKKAIEAIKAFWGNLTKKAKIILFSCLGAALLIAIITAVLMNRTQYTVLYSGIDNSEAQEITNELRSMNIDYQYKDGTIYVEKSSENSARMQLANEGYPKSAPNYDFFTQNVGVMTTDEERKIIERYQLETRLGSVIETLDSVNKAYVTISLPNSTDYAWEDNKSGASASVAISLAKGKTLDAKQVNGIKQLVAKSVPNLSVDDVTVMDTSTGEELTSSESSSEASHSMQITLSEFKLKIEKQYEESLENKIMNLLAQAYGRNNLSVSVKSKMDLDKKIEDIITYTPSTSDGKGVVSHSEETIETTSPSSAVGGVAGTTSNVDHTTTTYPGVTVSNGVITTKDSKTYDYLVSKVQQQVQSDAAALDDLTVAVVINTDNMTDDKKQEVTELVANAAAVDISKVAIMAAPINSTVSQAETQAVSLTDLLGSMANNQLVLIILGVLLLLVILLIVLLVSERRKARREKMLANLQPYAPEELPEEEVEEGTEEEEEAENGNEEEESEEEAEESEEAPAEESQPAEEQEDEDDMQIESIEAIRNAANGKEQRVKTELQEFSDRNPEIAAQLIRSWLKGDDKHG